MLAHARKVAAIQVAEEHTESTKAAAGHALRIQQQFQLALEAMDAWARTKMEAVATAAMASVIREAALPHVACERTNSDVVHEAASEVCERMNTTRKVIDPAREVATAPASKWRVDSDATTLTRMVGTAMDVTEVIMGAAVALTNIHQYLEHAWMVAAIPTPKGNTGEAAENVREELAEAHKQVAQLQQRVNALSHWNESLQK